MRAAIGWSVDLLDPGERRLLGRARGVPRRLRHGRRAGGRGRSPRSSSSTPWSTRPSSTPGAGGTGCSRSCGSTPASSRRADEGARARHARHYAELAERAEPELVGWRAGPLVRAARAGARQPARGARLGAAGDPALELRLAAALARFWYVRGYLGEGLARLRAAAGRSPEAPAAVRARALRGASALALLQGDYALARYLVEEALQLSRASDDLPGAVRSLSNLGAILHAQGELEQAAAALDECIADAERLGTARLVALAANNRGDVALTQGDLATAAARFEQSLAILRAENDVANVARALFNLGAVAVEQGRHDDARAQLAESLELAVAVDDSEDVAWCLIALAAVAEAGARWRDAALMVGFAEGLLERIGATTKPFERGLLARTRARLQEAMEPAALAEALWEGSHLPTASAVQLGASGDGQGVW